MDRWSQIRVLNLGLYRHDEMWKDEELRKAINCFLKNLTTKNEGLRNRFDELARVGIFTNDTILLTGETGTGKTHIAFQLHEAWCRSRKKAAKGCFHQVNCAGLTEELAHSEIFGHEKGAFTGAMIRRKGAMELADKGTLFLDEIGDLHPRVQGYLLTAIETKEFFPLGSEKGKKTDFRLICATNKSLKRLARTGKFREDLLARIFVWEFEMPPLRRRRDDIPMIVKMLMEKIFEERKSEKWPEIEKFRAGFGLSPKAKELLSKYNRRPENRWPGNFRDLYNLLNRSVVKMYLDDERDVTEENLKRELNRLERQWKQDDIGQSDLKKAVDVLLGHVDSHYAGHSPMENVERVVRKWALDKANGNKAKACEICYGERSNPTAHWNNREKSFDKKSS